MLLNRLPPASYIFRKIWIELLTLVLMAMVIFYLEMAVPEADGIVPLSVPAIMGTCISLLLAFRTSQSYDRWWEARKVWGAIVNDSRSLIRMRSQLRSWQSLWHRSSPVLQVS